MRTLQELLAAVVSDLAQLDGVRACEAFGGRFDLAGLERFGAAVPAIRVAILRIPASRTVDTGELDVDVEMAAFMITRDERGQSRDQQALDLASRVMAAVQAARWGLSKIHPARNIRAENIYSSPAQAKGVALWGVSWISRLRMGRNAYAPIDGSMPEIWARDARSGEEPAPVVTTGGQP